MNLNGVYERWLKLKVGDNNTMNIQYVEFAAELFFKMCREHPEICPHDYHWITKKDNEDGTETVNYRCSLCGSEITKIERK